MTEGYPDHKGNKSGVYSRAQWAVEQGVDFVYYITAANIAPRNGWSYSFVVQPGDTAFVTEMGFSIFATNAADAEKNQIGEAMLLDVGAGTYWGIIGGNGGGNIPFTQPKSFVAGTTVRLWIYNLSNHNCDLEGFMAGYAV